jgi:spermidine/putrescine-binding protein
LEEKQQSLYRLDLNSIPRGVVRLSKTAGITKLQAILLAIVITVPIVAVSAYYYLNSQGSSGGEITVSMWGSLYKDTFQQYAAEAFTEETGIKVNWLVQTGGAETLAKLRAHKTNPSEVCDIFVGASGSVEQAYLEGLTVPITDLFEEYPHVNASLHTDYRVTLWGVPHSFAIRTDLVPSDFPFNGSVNWFLDSRLRGRLALSPPGWGYIEVFAFLAGGGSEIDPRWDTLEAFARNTLVAAGSSAQTTQLLVSGDVWAVHTSVGNVIAAYKQLKDVGKAENLSFIKTYVDMQLPMSSDSIAVVRGPKEELAKKFIEFVFRPEVHSKIAATFPFVATNPATAALEIEFMTAQNWTDFLPFMLTEEELEVTYTPDFSVVAKSLDIWLERWQEQIVPLIGTPP